jgi:hypothetical protein
MHNREAYTALVGWVEEQRQRTGLSKNEILRTGVFR